MAVPQWLDRLWLTVIAVAFVIAVPIWAILSADRFGWPLVLGGVALALFIRYRDRLGL